MTFALAPLTPKKYRAIIIDPPWRFAAGIKSRPQHYPRLTFAECCALPVRNLLHPDGARVFCWITAPLGNRIGDLHRAWGLRYSTMLPWLKLWPGDDGMFIYAGSFARGTGFEVVGNAEYVAIFKYRKPQSIKGKPFRSHILAERRQHSRKPADLHEQIEGKLGGPYAEVFARASRPGWDTFGNEPIKFDAPAQAIVSHEMEPA